MTEKERELRKVLYELWKLCSPPIQGAASKKYCSVWSRAHKLVKPLILADQIDDKRPN